MRKKKRAVQLFNPDTIVNNVLSRISEDFKDYDKTEVCHKRAKARDLFKEAQIDNFLKKYVPVSRDDSALKADALEKFNSVNNQLSEIYSRGGLFDRILLNPEADLFRLLQVAKNVVHFILTPFTLEELFSEVKHGAGSTVGVKFAYSNLADKMTFPTTVTERCLPLFQLYLDSEKRYLQSCRRSGDRLFNIVEGSLSTFVEKDNKSVRLIAKEPTANMFLQQGAMHLMVNRLKPFLDLETLQFHHREIVKNQSLICKLSTIDFSQASDSIAKRLCEFLLPREWFILLDTIRCHRGKFGTPVDLFMMSSMGNATTFPLETVVFFSLAYASCFINRVPGRSTLPDFSKDWVKLISVYGDDCILPNEDAELFTSICNLLGMKVNKNKTFIGVEKPFRESCGADFYHFMDVRPFFVKGPYDCKIGSLEPWLYIVTNNLFKKYVQYFGGFYAPYYAGFLEYIDQLFAEHDILIKIVPSTYPDNAGLKIYDPRALLMFQKSKFSKVIIDKHGVVFFKSIVFQPFSNDFIFKDGKYARRERIRCYKNETANYFFKLRSLENSNLKQITEAVEIDYLLKGKGRFQVVKNSTHVGFFRT